jgi:hypothetical protein
VCCRFDLILELENWEELQNVTFFYKACFGCIEMSLLPDLNIVADNCFLASTMTTEITSKFFHFFFATTLRNPIFQI